MNFPFPSKPFVTVQTVIPAKAGIQFSTLDPRLRGDDNRGTERLQPFFVRDSQKGSLLILVLFALMTLSLLAFSVGNTVHQKLKVVSRLEARAHLRLAAESAVDQASLLIQEKAAGSSYHALNQFWSNQESLFKKTNMGKAYFSILASGERGDSDAIYGLTDEDRKINLNQASAPVLQALFEIAAHVEKEEARRIVSAIRDWKDEDQDLTDGGAESKDYLARTPPYRAKNGLFNSLEELRWVQGVTSKIFLKVKPHLTLDASKINVNTAPQVVLQAMGLDAGVASKMIGFREGKDKKEGTGDDGVFTNLVEVPDILSRYIYLNEEDRKNLESVFSNGFSVQSTFFHAQILAQLTHQSQKIKVSSVLDRQGEVMRWHEEFF